MNINCFYCLEVIVMVVNYAIVIEVIIVEFKMDLEIEFWSLEVTFMFNKNVFYMLACVCCIFIKYRL